MINTLNDFFKNSRRFSENCHIKYSPMDEIDNIKHLWKREANLNNFPTNLNHKIHR